jgi:hypothetical protein
VTAGHATGLALLLAAAYWLDLSTVNGVFVAVIGGALYNLVAAAVQSVGLLNGGLAAAIAPVSLLEHLSGDESEMGPVGEPEPVPESVRA